MENRNQVVEEETIDLLELVRMLKSKWLILVAAFLTGALIAASYTIFFVTPMYKASSMIYVYTQTTSITSLADLQIGSQLTIDFQIIGTTRDVVEAASREIGLNQSYETVVKKVTITNPSNSRILTITVTDADPQIAADLSNALAHQLRLRIAQVMNSDVPSTVERAIVPKTPASPSLTKNVAIGGMGVFAVVAAIYVIAFLLDDTIKNEDDVEKFLRQNVLAVVPVITYNNKRKHRRHKKAHATA